MYSGTAVWPMPCKRPLVICWRPTRKTEMDRTQMAGPAAGVAYKRREIGTAKTARPKQAGTVMRLAIRMAVWVRDKTTSRFPWEKAAETAGTRLVAREIVKIAGSWTRPLAMPVR